jgi:GT2 family glycosyltransferase
MAMPSVGSLAVGAPLERSPQRRLAVVVLNHRTAEDTYRFAASLMASHRRPDHLIVVDNDVADQCRAHFQPNAQRPEPRAQSPEITYLHTGCNLGFSGGMNVGTRAALDAGADLVLLANSDIVVSPDCLEHLESALLSEGGAGIAGPLVLSRTHPDRVASAGICYNSRSGRMRELGVGTKAVDASLESHNVDAVSGCLMLVTRTVFDTIGFLDERYFFGFEDLDFCRRAHAEGFSTILVNRAVAYHEGGRSIGQTSSRRWYFGARNHLLLASQREAGEGQGARALRLSWVTALNLAHALTADTGSLPARLAATARGLRDHLSGRYGPDPAA